MKDAADNLARVSLELGGKSPNIVFEDADLEAAANGVVAGIFAATGQTCMAGSRLFVQERVHDELVERLSDRAGTIKLGDRLDPDTEMGAGRLPATAREDPRPDPLGACRSRTSRRWSRVRRAARPSRRKRPAGRHRLDQRLPHSLLQCALRA